jgi:hypothetical protein
VATVLVTTAPEAVGVAILWNAVVEDNLIRGEASFVRDDGGNEELL